MTVGILNSQGHVSEYWFKDGIEDSNLVPKMPEVSGLPSWMKIARFDRNLGSGHMNSILSDEDGYVKLPECTFVQPSGQGGFEGWGMSNNTSADYEPNAEVALTDDITTFYAIWSGAVTYTVTFDTNTISCELQGGSAISSGQSVNAGSTLVFTYINNAQDKAFNAWTGFNENDDVTEGTNPYTATIANVSRDLVIGCIEDTLYKLGIRFPSEPHGTFRIAVDGQAYTTAQAQQYIAPGVNVILEYVPTTGNENWSIDSWGYGSDITPITENGLQISFIMPFQNVNMIPHEIEVQATITVSFYTTNGGNTLIASWTGAPSTTLGTVISETQAVASYSETGYTINGWAVFGETTPKDVNYTFSDSEDMYPVKQPNQYQITTTVSPNGSGTANGGGTYTHGSTVTLTASASTGYSFVNWTKGGNVVSISAAYSFTATSSGEYVANFEQLQPDQVEVVGLSGTKKYASTMQDRIDNGTITSSQYVCTPGQENTITIPRNTNNDTKGYSVLLPQGYKVNVNSVHFYDAIGNEFDKTIANVNCTHGLPYSSSDGTMTTGFTYNGETLQGYFMSLDDNTPTTVKFIVENE